MVDSIRLDPNTNSFKLRNVIDVHSKKIHMMKNFILGAIPAYTLFGEVSFDTVNDKWEVTNVLGLFKD